MFEYVYPSIYSENFEDKIFRKKEFHDLRLTLDAEISKTMKYQEFIRRFLSSKTPYNSLFLFHKMGTGKTRTSIRLIEELQQSGQYKNYIILTPNTLLSVNYRNEILLASPGKYNDNEKEGLSPAQIKRRTFSNINKIYQLDTFVSFYKRIRHLSDDKIIKLYSNCVVIIDEVHNLITDNQYQLDNTDIYGRIKNKVYREIFRFLHVIENSKVLIMSGTPLRDKPYQIADVLNLINPLDNQMDVDANFISKYLIKNPDDTFSLNPRELNDFESFVRGKVSFLKSPRNPNVKLVFKGTEIEAKFDHDIEGDKVYFTKMSDFQSEYYDIAYSRDTKEHVSFYLNSTQASMFVFPDGTWGDEGFKKYVKEGKTMSGMKTFKFTDQFTSEFKGYKTIEEKLEKLGKFSQKFAAAINGINLTPGKCFVFSRIVFGSGLILFSLLLELILGYGRLNSGNSDLEPRNRYILLSSTVDASTTRTQGLLKTINDVKNARGKYVKVILGSESISEGVTMKDVIRMDKLNPDWNEVINEQSTARIYRLGSHNNLIKRKGNVEIRIYKHCCNKTAANPSIEEYMYTVSQQKNISNKRIEFVLKQNAIDCGLFYEKNYTKGTDFSLECDFSVCSYKCAGIKNLLPPYNEDIKLDTITFYRYWASEKIEENISLIRRDFSSVFSRQYAGAGASLLFALKAMIDNRLILHDKYGFQVFLNENNDTFFVSGEIGRQSIEDKWYVENRISVKRRPPQILLTDICMERLKNIVADFNKLGPQILDRYFSSFPNYVNQLIIENVIKSLHIGNEKNIEFKKYVLKRFRGSITKQPGKIILSYNNFRCFEGDSWVDCPKEDKSKIVKEKEKEVKRVVEIARDFGIYGIKKGDKFLIKQKQIEGAGDKRKQPRGQVCGTIKKPKLLEYISILGIDYPSEFMNKLVRDDLVKEAIKRKIGHEKKSDDELRRQIYFSDKTNKLLCSIIENWFTERDMITKE